MMEKFLIKSDKANGNIVKILLLFSTILVICEIVILFK